VKALGPTALRPRAVVRASGVGRRGPPPARRSGGTPTGGGVNAPANAPREGTTPPASWWPSHATRGPSGGPWLRRSPAPPRPPSALLPSGSGTARGQGRVAEALPRCGVGRVRVTRRPPPLAPRPRPAPDGPTSGRTHPWRAVGAPGVSAGRLRSTGSRQGHNRKQACEPLLANRLATDVISTPDFRRCRKRERGTSGRWRQSPANPCSA
jgi:hypothetical protein